MTMQELFDTIKYMRDEHLKAEMEAIGNNDTYNEVFNRGAKLALQTLLLKLPDVKK